MPKMLVLASSSATRQAMLRQVGLDFLSVPPQVDESVLKEELLATRTSPADIARTLAAEKARSVSERHQNAYVLGSDQVLALDGMLFSKPTDPQDAAAQLQRLSGRAHELISGTVILSAGQEAWSNVTITRMTMRAMSEEFIHRYVERNWSSIRWSVGGYKIEEEGARLFEKIEGDHFNVLGMPLLDVITFLEQAGVIER